jgi:excisionase family DNA binding protein
MTADMVKFRNKFIYMHLCAIMADLLTPDEAAMYLRLPERKPYELVAQGAVPCTKITGRWLFPRAAHHPR